MINDPTLIKYFSGGRTSENALNTAPRRKSRPSTRSTHPRPKNSKYSYVIYYVGGRRPEIVSDDLDDMNDASLFADWLSVSSALPRKDFFVVTTAAY